MGKIWNVVFSHEFIAGMLLVLAIKQAVDGNFMWAGIGGFLFAANFAFAVWPPKT